MKKILLALATIALVAACSSTPETQESAPVEDRTGGKPGATTEPVRPTVIPSTAITDPSKDPRLKDPSSILSKRSVYFDFDSYSVKPDYQSMLNAHAQYLGTNKGRKILIQGNTDERGTSEYNLALGQKRAEAVRRSLASMGVPDSQMEAVSLGKEKPKATGHDEASWAENRRADINY